MTIALWDHPACALLDAGLSQMKGVEVVHLHPSLCADALRHGQVDAALLSPLEILRTVEDFDVLPSVALSAWSYPFARLALPGKLGDSVPTVHFDPDYPMEALIARIVLAEHYALDPAQVECGVCDVEDLLSAGEAVLLTGSGAADYFQREDGEGILLDLGQEWSELAGYPLVLGLMAVPKGSVDAAMVQGANAMSNNAEEGRRHVGHELEDFWHDYFENELRVRYDDVVIASLTEFSQYLLFYGILDEVPDIPVVYIEDDEADGPLPLI